MNTSVADPVGADSNASPVDAAVDVAATGMRVHRALQSAGRAEGIYVGFGHWPWLRTAQRLVFLYCAALVLDMLRMSVVYWLQ